MDSFQATIYGTLILAIIGLITISSDQKSK